ncbi:MAG: hypothetical protein IKP88_20275 [Lachnospiraceae bacterium]|nr:hypothetical protein [Lachnospiraceae bacterium]
MRKEYRETRFPYNLVNVRVQANSSYQLKRVIEAVGIFLMIPLLHFYNEEPGRKTIVNKWLFYVFYPLHLILIWLIF